MEAAKNQIKCGCKEIIDVITMDVALAAADRPAPLYYTQNTQNHSSKKEEVQAWVSATKKDRDLVASYELVRGFEYPVIINTGGLAEISSRSSAQFVRVRSNFFLDMMIAKAELLKDGHECGPDHVMNRNVRPKFEPSISALTDPICEDLGMNVSLGPLSYHKLQQNCILECLADQCQKLDGEEFSSIKNGLDLLKEIITSLTEETIQWPLERPASNIWNWPFKIFRPDFDPGIPVDRQEWIRVMSEINPNAYDTLIRIPDQDTLLKMTMLEKLLSGMTSRRLMKFDQHDALENLLIELSSRYLKRTIVLHPLLGDQPKLTFPQRSVFSKFSNSSEKTYNLLCIKKSYTQNVFWSVLKRTS